MKVLRITMPDGSKWDVPVEVIARNRAAYYADREFAGDVERSLREDTLPLFEDDPFEVEDWAANNMDWADVKDKATRFSPAVCDFQEGWITGDKEVVEEDR